MDRWGTLSARGNLSIIGRRQMMHFDAAISEEEMNPDEWQLPTLIMLSNPATRSGRYSLKGNGERYHFTSTFVAEGRGLAPCLS